MFYMRTYLKVEGGKRQGEKEKLKRKNRKQGGELRPAALLKIFLTTRKFLCVEISLPEWLRRPHPMPSCPRWLLWLY
jgi:hypothetical protein